MLGYKRLQFNINLHQISKFAPMKDLRAMLFPVLWVEEVSISTVYNNDIDVVLLPFNTNLLSVINVKPNSN
jgi:hypothetical protein